MCNNPQKLYYYILYLYSNASQENYFTTYKIFFKLVWKFIELRYNHLELVLPILLKVL